MLVLHDSTDESVEDAADVARFARAVSLGVQVIDPERPGSQSERDLLQTVYRLSQKAGLPKMPEVGVYESPEVNAFATGPSKSRALVAVSTGLLEQMDLKLI